jgi:hypothetical protein
MADDKKNERVDFTPAPIKSKKDDERYAPAGKVVRMEIICTQALEEDFMQEFDENKVGARYTKLPAIMGAGYSNPCLGDAIWPQLNVMFIIYCSEEDSATLKEIVWKLRDKYRTEGIACFVGSAEEV